MSPAKRSRLEDEPSTTPPPVLVAGAEVHDDYVPALPLPTPNTADGQVGVEYSSVYVPGSAPALLHQEPSAAPSADQLHQALVGAFGSTPYNLRRALLVYNYDELLNVVTDPTKEVTRLAPLSEECLLVSWEPVE